MDVGRDAREVCVHVSSLLEASVDLSAFRRDRVAVTKKTVGLFFSGSWRPPCVDELAGARLDVKFELVLDVSADTAAEERGVTTPHRCAASHRARLSESSLDPRRLLRRLDDLADRFCEASPRGKLVAK